MAEERSSHRLVSFENVSASVGGYDISDIVELSLKATSNSVPQVTLLVDVGPDGGRAAEAISLSNARGVLDACREMVRTDGATLSLSVTCRIDGRGGSESQTLSVNGWILTDVAMSPIQRKGVCTAALSFQHPLCKAHLGGAVPALVAIPPTLDNVEDGNPLAVFVRALRIYEAAQRSATLPAAIPGARSPAEIREHLLSRLSKAASDLESHLSWTHGGLPAMGYLGGWGDLICKGIARYAAPSGGNSVLQTLLGYLVPECSLAVGGDYTRSSLDIGPFEPWADASLSIDDSDIVSMDFPQRDPTPISGVRMIMSVTNSSTGVSYHPIGCQTKDPAYLAETFYVPDSELSSQYMYGPIQQFSEPGWMVQMAQYELARSASPTSDSALVGGGKLKTAVTTPRGGGVSFGPGSGGGGSSIDYSQALLACGKAYFETSLMKDWTFTATARLMFSANGGILCPGKVISIKADSSEVLGGYVVGVEHVISVPNRAATTRIMCTHPRFGELPAAITSTRNALY